MIHPSAIIHPKAQLDPTVEVGPFAIVDEHVRVGAGTKVEAHVWLTGWTEIGPENQIGYGTVIGSRPQALSYKGERSFVRIGKGNMFREYCTVHRGMKEDSATVIGDNNFLMAQAHIAHNCILGNQIIVANAAILGGHVEIEDQALLSGACIIHQFTRVGKLALLAGGARISKDLPPYMLVYDTNVLRSFNRIGLRRAGLGGKTRLLIREAYSLLGRSGLNTSQALEKIKQLEKDPAIDHLIRFIESSKRGICGGSQDGTEDVD